MEVMVNYVVRTAEGCPMAGFFAPITNFEKAKEYARGLVFTAQLPEITEALVFGINEEGEEIGFPLYVAE